MTGVYPIAENFSFFSSVVRGHLKTAANPGESLIQSCAEKFEGFFALYPMKFDLL